MDRLGSNCGCRSSRCCRSQAKTVAGRPWIPDQQALRAAVFVLHTGGPFAHVAQELGFGSGMTCWRPLAVERGRRVRPSSCRSADGAAGREAAGLIPGGDRLQPRPGRSARPEADTVRLTARPDSKHHVLVDGQGIPLAVSPTGGNRNDITQLISLLAKVPSDPRPRASSASTSAGKDATRPRSRPRPRHLPHHPPQRPMPRPTNPCGRSCHTFDVGRDQQVTVSHASPIPGRKKTTLMAGSSSADRDRGVRSGRIARAWSVSFYSLEALGRGDGQVAPLGDSCS